jgi:hypothetical protein
MIRCLYSVAERIYLCSIGLTPAQVFTILLSSWQQVLCTCGKVACCESDNLSPSTAEVKNGGAVSLPSSFFITWLLII